MLGLKYISLHYVVIFVALALAGYWGKEGFFLFCLGGL
jgi:hypothetical protein